MKCGLETTRVTTEAGTESAVSRSQATRQSLPVSVLDLVATRAGESAGSAIARSVELARHVEQLGYKRYWVAEHHSIQGLACSIGANSRGTRGYYTWQDYVIGRLKINSLLEGAALPALRRNVNAEKR